MRPITPSELATRKTISKIAFPFFGASLGLVVMLIAAPDHAGLGTVIGGCLAYVFVSKVYLPWLTRSVVMVRDANPAAVGCLVFTLLLVGCVWLMVQNGCGNSSNQRTFIVVPLRR
jgi:hypothetical protein